MTSRTDPGRPESVTVPGGVPRRLAAALAGEVGCLFLSPHLDDAVLSCGSLIQALRDRCPVTVATVFTAAGPRPHTLAARSFLRQCSVPDAGTLYAARRTEDREVLDRIGVGHVHLGVPDALFRRREVPRPVSRRLGRAVLPELLHRYPTFRYDAARGRVAAGDRRLVGRLTHQVADVMRRTGTGLVFAPLGVGRHVDHVIARMVGEQHMDRVVYYSDFPYNTTCEPDNAFIARHRLTPWAWTTGIPEKAQLFREYRSQHDALFPSGRIPAAPEVYFTAAS